MRKYLFFLVVALFVFGGTSFVQAQAIYQQGDNGQEIVKIQQRLFQLGLYAGETDGDFGSNTTEAVKAFQRSRDLTPDGIVGDETYTALAAREPETSRGYARPNARQIIDFGMKFIGVPYVFGGTSPHGFDCSGYVQYVFAKYGISLPRTADMQFAQGQSVSRNDLQPGDLVYFTTYEPGASHEGIYIGDGRFLNAQSSRGVAIASLSNIYWASHYFGAKRILSVEQQW